MKMPNEINIYSVTEFSICLQNNVSDILYKSNPSDVSKELYNFNITFIEKFTPRLVRE